MKILLGVSLLTNLILVYFLWARGPQKEVIERLIIETHETPSQKEPRDLQRQRPLNSKPLPEIKEKESIPADYNNLTSYELQDAGEKMESDRLYFLTQELGLSEDKIDEHNQIREDFFQKTSKYWERIPIREPTLQERKQMLLLEEELHQKLEALYGKKKMGKI